MLGLTSAGLAKARGAPAADDSLPEWLDSLKAELLSTEEWGALVRNVYDGVTHRLAENHIQFFSDLSAQEKSLFVDEVEKSLFSAPVYRKFQGMLSRSLDLSLSASLEFDMLEALDLDNAAFDPTGMTDAEVADAKRKALARRRLQTEKAQLANGGATSKVDKILERASEGAVQLLKRLPNEKSTLRIMLNRDFPPKLRFQAWRLFLGNPAAREKYTSAMAVSRMSTISERDAEISEMCQDILSRKFQDDVVSRVPNSHTIMVMMKTALSYYQKFSTTANVPEQYYYYVVPLVYIYGRNYDSAASVIESFFGLLDMPRPKFMASVTPQITATLRKHDRDLFEHVSQTFQARKLSSQNSTRSGGGGGSGSGGGQSDESHFAELLEETVLRLFVGTLNIDCCCYVWDQCLMLGSFERMVPNYCVAMLILLRENIIKADTPAQIMRRIGSQARTISPRRMQALAERLFMSALRKDLGISVVNTMGSKPGMELFDVVMREDRQWNEGVNGLDKALAWDGFAMGDKWTGAHPRMGGRWVRGGGGGGGGAGRGSVDSKEGQNAGGKMGQELALEAADRRQDAMKSTKLKSAAELEREFNEHLGGDWAKRQAAEKRRLKEERREAVRRAERDLLMSEEERSTRTQSEKDSERRAKEKRYNELSAKRAKLRAEKAKKEAAKFRNDEAEKKAQRDRDDQRSRNEELQAMERERRDGLGQTGLAGTPYLGKDDAPVMTLKLKDAGLERKLAIRALMGDDTVDGDGMARVEHALHEAKLPLSKTGQILKLLHKFSKTRAGYVEKKASEVIESHNEKLGPSPAEMKSATPDGKGSMPPGNQVSPPRNQASPPASREKPAEFSYFGDKKAPVMKISLSTKTKKSGGKKIKIKLEMFTLVPGDTLVDAKIRVENAFNVANPGEPLEPKKVQKIVDALVKQSVKKKTGWNEKQAKKDEGTYTSINHKRRAETGGGQERSGGGATKKSSTLDSGASSKVAAKSRAMVEKAANADASEAPPGAGKIFSHTFQSGSIGLSLDMIFGSNSGDGVEVHRISPGGQASAVNDNPKTEFKIGVGDHLQKVADVDVTNMHLGNKDEGVMREIMRASRPLTLTFKKCEDRLFTCEFPAGQIGLKLDDSPNTEGRGIEVMGVVAGSSASKATPAIKVGDRLVHIATHNITHLEYDLTMEYLQQEPRPVVLTFRRQSRPGGADTVSNATSNAIKEAQAAHDSTQSPAAAAAIAAAKAASDSEEPHVAYKKTDPNNPPHRGGDNSSRPLVLATMRVMDALRQLALGNATEQEDTRQQIKEENAALAEDMTAAEKKVFGKNGKPTQDEVDGMNAKRKKKYDTQIAKMKKIADGNFKKRQKRLRKERAKSILKMQKQMAAFKKK